MIPQPIERMLPGMNLPDHPNVALLDSAVETLFNIYLLRGECSRTARRLVEKRPGDAHSLEECARLDDSLAKAFRLLQTTLSNIQKSRANPGKPTH